LEYVKDFIFFENTKYPILIRNLNKLKDMKKRFKHKLFDLKKH